MEWTEEDGPKNSHEEEGGDSDPERSANTPARRKLAIKTILYLAMHRSILGIVTSERGPTKSLSRNRISNNDDVNLRRASMHRVLLLDPII